MNPLIAIADALSPEIRKMVSATKRAALLTPSRRRPAKSPGSRSQRLTEVLKGPVSWLIFTVFCGICVSPPMLFQRAPWVAEQGDRDF
ncbi:hypothetical protein [Bradyrhizobium japonicum]|uniref:hypothetical protein n=1 Tax=Bradyrhizobium japonicum TaxID=375 RepID=UPI00126A6B99|nr:hypothetical protein [Bradyrhizobium japonicum]